MSKMPRVSPEQRQKLLEYMQAHEDLARDLPQRGRVAGADESAETRDRAGTGGGPSPPPLSLLTFCGIEILEGIQGVADPLVEAQNTDTVEAEAGTTELFTVEEIADSSTPRQESRRANKNNSDQKLNEILAGQAAALEELSKSLNNFAEVVATGLQGIAAAVNSIARALEQ